MKIIQPSPHELICRKDGNIQEVLFTIAKITAIGFAFSLLFTTKQGFHSNSTLILPIFPIFCFLWLIFTHDRIATFNLDLQSVEIESYLILLKKRYRQKYNLATIRNVHVEKNHQFTGYKIVLKQFDGGKDIYLPSPDSTDISIADTNAQKIRDFLGLNIKSIR